MDRMITRRNRPHYFVLNDGIDEEAPPEDQLDSSQLHISMDTLPDSDIFPSDSVSTLVSSLAVLGLLQYIRAKPWILKKSNARKMIDREIRCSVSDEKTGQQKRHSIEAQDRPEPTKKPKSSILAYFGEREKLSQQQLLEKNILQWIVTEKQPFTTLESPAFRQIFHDIPGITLPFSSRHTLRQRLVDNFTSQLGTNVHNSSSFSRRVDE
ncbi:hypothetical protein POJ06DRAFT_282527 [Lipomyces tetrasporus]|uniref:Uncharacterized protein n=1 Tax=Lipomyces tetrasporus TaxID=54092 RepID=A0AAD7QN94_9ASCO|nr:uncharacterized protein POJ06DRAFT_282527 [Lipomyces tetrasporus]KAJ8098517.1 hypothetical protein POJ06DRAFT_282527 [Lipomyces tetrasporus]